MTSNKRTAAHRTGHYSNKRILGCELGKRVRWLRRPEQSPPHEKGRTLKNLLTFGTLLCLLPLAASGCADNETDGGTEPRASEQKPVVIQQPTVHDAAHECGRVLGTNADIAEIYTDDIEVLKEEAEDLDSGVPDGSTGWHMSVSLLMDGAVVNSECEVIGTPGEAPSYTASVDYEIVGASPDEEFFPIYTCLGTEADGGGVYTDASETWARATGVCQVTLLGGTLSDVQSQAIHTAWPDYETTDLEYLRDDLARLYATCTEKEPAPEIYLSGLQHDRASALLCPDHPRVDVLNNGHPDWIPRQEAMAAGTYIEDGSYLVGSQMLPGTWQTVSETVKDCYWEISDSQGGIIDNNFITFAGQLEVSVPSDATGFTTSHCGDWQRIG